MTLPNYYEFLNPTKICSGVGALERLNYEMAAFHCERPLFVTDKTIDGLGMPDAVSDLMESKPAAYFREVPADSGLDVIRRGGYLYREAQCDSIIALGGGSVMDTAKGIRLLAIHGATDLKELMGCEQPAAKSRVPFFAIPTTVGTGSEATDVAVVAHSSHQLKLELISSELFPDVAFLDPQVTQSLPKRVLASSSIDALTHAVEAFTSTQKNPLSDSYAVAAIALIQEALPAAMENEDSEDARMALANAALLSGAAFSNAMVGAVHAIGHALGGVCRVPHGEAMAILLPHVMEYNLDVCLEEYGALLLHIGGIAAYAATPAQQRAERTIQIIREMIAELHERTELPVKLSHTGRVTEGDFQKLAETALIDGAVMANRKALEPEDVLNILKAAY